MSAALPPRPSQPSAPRSRKVIFSHATVSVVQVVNLLLGIIVTIAVPAPGWLLGCFLLATTVAIAFRWKGFDVLTAAVNGDAAPGARTDLKWFVKAALVLTTVIGVIAFFLDDRGGSLGVLVLMVLAMVATTACLWKWEHN